MFTSILLVHGQLQVLIFKSFEAKYKHQAKSIIKAGISENDLVKLTFHKSIFEKEIPNFEWKEKHEFSFKEEMYDIVRTEIQTDSVTFFCYHDVEESELFRNMKEQFVNNISNFPNDKSNLIYNVFSFNKYYNSISFYSNNTFYDNVLRFLSIESGVLFGYNKVITPPPNTSITA